MNADRAERRAALSVQPFRSDTRDVDLARLAVAIALLALPASACAPSRAPAPGGDPLPETIRVAVGSSVVRVPMDEYVRTVILSEVAPRAGEARAAVMFEVQAILSRTYALSGRHRAEGFDVCATTHCQVYDPARAASARWRAAAGDAVRRTRGVLVWFGAAPARVVYHADCGGRTSAAADVWSGAPLSYLVSVGDDGPARAAHDDWRFAPATAALVAALNGDRDTRIGRRLERLRVVRRDRAGRAQVVELQGERPVTVRGEDLRRAVNRAFGARALRSTRFEVTRLQNGFVFTGRGFGHGVGLCQAGAFARVAAGARPADVLAHYFPGTSVH